MLATARGIGNGLQGPLGVVHPAEQVVPAPQRFARGWHCLGLASEFADGKPHAVQGFGGKLVVWADTQGELQVLDGYCRHMGGDLTQGEVKGESFPEFPIVHYPVALPDDQP